MVKIEAFNLLHPAPQDLPEELVEVLTRQDDLRIERIVSRGHASPPEVWYDQGETEWLALLAGRARLRFADPPVTLELEVGDSLTIPPHRRHRVEWTAPDQDTIWLAVFYR